MNITYRQMQKEDIAKITPLFIEYWNGTGDEWTPELVYSRVWQVLGSPDSYCMIAEDGDNTVGFAMGRFETFYDLTAYNLVEIIVATEYQKSGIGTLSGWLSQNHSAIVHGSILRSEPRSARTAVWALPRSLAATYGITCCFLFLRVLRCFSSPGSPPYVMDWRMDT